MKRTRTEYAFRKSGFNNMFVESDGLTYEEMKNLKEGERLRIFFAGAWHMATFIRHEATNVFRVIFDKQIVRKRQKVTFVPNGLEFDPETFDRIHAGSHVQKIKSGKGVNR